ncbi:MAG: NAD(P)-binding domain-containing protein, partial [Bacillales bacterium]|nr:NAD(P)-binding domain-containing protein [Bacillales bacterium]
MEIGLIGLGKMGFHLALNMMDHHHHVVAVDKNQEQVERFVQAGGKGVSSLDELVNELSAPRVIWVMVPAGEATENVINELSDKLEAGDVIIDGGNSHYKDTIRRAETLKAKQIYLLDAGTSCGMEGARNGA